MPFSDSPPQRLPAGFEGLLEHHLDGLYRFALSLTRQPAEAEDVLQDSVLKGLEAFGRFEAGGNFKAWIFAILMNTFRDRYRHLQRRRVLEVPLDDLVDPPSVGEEVFDLMLKEEVLGALEELPADFRHAVHLVDLEGMSYREASQVLDCPTGTLTSRLNRGRKLLKVSLANLARERGLLAGEAENQGRPL
ncbi:MAG TPA: sigma-70 family RNA polymerase sigma factor [bacterium]|jgi:RNA polymerase sigma-70 factor (ECF subfamily)|nr:sigma-70 family RNA polymerase sigma factor [bacterium]